MSQTNQKCYIFHYAGIMNRRSCNRKNTSDSILKRETEKDAEKDIELGPTLLQATRHSV